jgi:geranylgeranyl reductase family protein
VIRCDALVVGGGPGGSTCARLLKRAGWNVLVVDRARFPRDKVCAGWLTPDVFPLLELDPDEYRSTGLTFQEITGFRTAVIGGRVVETSYPHVASYAIRRVEFDHFLLRRADVRVEQMPLTSLRRNGGTWIANEAIETPVVVGAGGHFCPVARHLRGERDEQPAVVAKEAEFLLDGHQTQVDERVPELFFCRDLQGYGWCVRKGRYVNVGIGRRDHRGFGEHVSQFVAFLERNGTLTRAGEPRWRGHAYLASGTGPRPLVGPGMLLVGDAAGLAYPESGEGIKPAIESGRLAAQHLIAAEGYSTDDLQPFADALERLHPPAPARAAPLRAAMAAVGRLLLGSPVFTRHVVLDRWFLRT